MDTPVPVLLIIDLKGGQDSQFNFGSIAVLLNRADDFHGHILVAVFVIGLNDFTKCTLTKKSNDLICLLLVLCRCVQVIRETTYISL